MVKEATKEVAEYLRADVRNYMKEDFKGMISTVESHFAAIFTKAASQNNNQSNIPQEPRVPQ
eukprot:1203826-Ditylum_brightwellii.AAC.1